MLKKILVLVIGLSYIATYAQAKILDKEQREAIVILIQKIGDLETRVKFLEDKAKTPLLNTLISKYTVVVRMANIRECPSPKCSIRKVAKSGELLDVLKQLPNNWSMLQNGTYIYSQLIQKIQ